MVGCCCFCVWCFVFWCLMCECLICAVDGLMLLCRCVFLVVEFMFDCFILIVSAG